MLLRTHRFDRLMSCRWSHSDGFPSLSPELLQLQLFLSPHRFHLVLVSALQKKYVSITTQYSSNGMDTTAPCLIRVITFPISRSLSLWMRKLHAASCAISP